jgi:hypothetical protein
MEQRHVRGRAGDRPYRVDFVDERQFVPSDWDGRKIADRDRRIDRSGWSPRQSVKRAGRTTQM